MSRGLASAFLLILAGLFIAARTALMKEAAVFVLPHQAVLIQNAIAFVLFLPIALRRGFQLLKTRRLGTQVFRGLTDMGAMLIAFLLLQTLVTVYVTLMLNWGPIFVPILALLFYSKRFDKLGLLYQLIGWTGVVFVCVAPMGYYGFYLLFGILVGFLGGATLLSSNSLTKVPATTTIFYGHLTAAVVLLPGLLWAWNPLTLLQWGILAMIALSTLIIEGLVFVGVWLYEGGRYLMPLLYTALIFSGLADFFIWNYIPGAFLLVGLVLATVAACLIQERRPGARRVQR